jgi:hypothetical protein
VNRFFEYVAKVKYLRITQTDQNCVHKEIKSRLNSGNLGTVQFRVFFSSRLLSSNVKVKIYKIIILPVVLYGCETWSLTLREEHRLRLFENRVQSRIFECKRNEITGKWRKLHSGELHSLYLSANIIRQFRPRRRGGWGMWYAWERRGNCTRL